MIWRCIVLQSILMLTFTLPRNEINAIPLEVNAEQSEDLQFAEEYASLKHALINDLGYTKEFAELVEINLKRAIKEEQERQRQLGATVPDVLRQGNQQAANSEEYDEDDSTTGPTTPRVLPGDVVRGIAGIVTSLGTFNVRNFWQSFVNFFPPNQREQAQALVDASLGRRPAQWPTLPTTTTKLTTTTKDEDEIDSEETTKAATTAVVATTAVGSLVSSANVASGTTPTVIGSVSAKSVTETVLRIPTTKYTLIKRRLGTSSPNSEGLRIDDNFLLRESSMLATTAKTNATALSFSN